MRLKATKEKEGLSSSSSSSSASRTAKRLSVTTDILVKEASEVKDLLASVPATRERKSEVNRLLQKMSNFLQEAIKANEDVEVVEDLQNDLHPPSGVSSHFAFAHFC